MPGELRGPVEILEDLMRVFPLAAEAFVDSYNDQDAFNVAEQRSELFRDLISMGRLAKLITSAEEVELLRVFDK